MPFLGKGNEKEGFRTPRQTPSSASLYSPFLMRARAETLTARIMTSKIDSKTAITRANAKSITFKMLEPPNRVMYVTIVNATKDAQSIVTRAR